MAGLYNLTEDQQSLVEMIRDFMTNEIKPHVLEWEKEGHYPQEIIQMGIDMGLHMMQVPEEYGGMGLDTTTTALLLEEGGKIEGSYMGILRQHPAEGLPEQLLPDRAGRRLGQRRRQDHGRAQGRQVCDQRHQDVHHQRFPGQRVPGGGQRGSQQRRQGPGHLHCGA